MPNQRVHDFVSNLLLTLEDSKVPSGEDWESGIRRLKSNRIAEISDEMFEHFACGLAGGSTYSQSGHDILGSYDIIFDAYDSATVVWRAEDSFYGVRLSDSNGLYDLVDAIGYHPFHHQ